LRKVARANSESVEELAEEGQSFEADVVAGVEEAEDAEESEVATHEVPEDDVPSEYDNEH
jgi:ABC-type thiamine transport system substrate-binding protein